MNDRRWRRVNLALALLWLGLVPAAYASGWLGSVVFVAAASLYANFVSHVAAWRADSPSDDEAERLARIEEKLDELLAREAA